jgi:hypothetical protein
LARWLQWETADKEALFELAIALKVGENHLRDLMDGLGEIALRDQSKVHEILAQKVIAAVRSDPRLGRADKLKRIKEQIRRLRFPRLSRIEDSIRTRIQELRLPPAVRVAAPPGLEGGYLHVEFSASTPEELRSFAGQLAELASNDSVKEIFRMLTGQSAEN